MRNNLKICQFTLTTNKVYNIITEIICSDQSNPAKHRHRRQDPDGFPQDSRRRRPVWWGGAAVRIRNRQAGKGERGGFRWLHKEVILADRQRQLRHSHPAATRRLQRKRRTRRRRRTGRLGRWKPVLRPILTSRLPSQPGSGSKPPVSVAPHPRRDHL
jgi:hypothetical protein